MSHLPFRFLHASDLRLDEVPRGLSEVPDHLRDCLLDAPYTAARRIFDAAIAERAAFVLLAGNILKPREAGPRGSAFLIEQFERLAAAGIDVYWAAGASDRPDAWPGGQALPKNVHVFIPDHVTEFLHPADGPPLARIVGTSRGSRDLHPAEFVPDPVGLFSIAVACGEMDVAEMKEQGIHYWALGGRAERETLFDTAQYHGKPAPAADGPAISATSSIAHYPGTPQGRSPAETGSRGCTLIAVDESGRARLSPVPCSALEWHEETIAVDATTGRDGLETKCAERIRSLAAHSKCDLLVTWTISGNGPLVTELRRGKLRGELLEWLRIEHGLSAPFVWTVALDVAPSASLPNGLYDQQTILGDYLRELREYEHDPERPIEVNSLLTSDASREEFAKGVAIMDAGTRQRVLHEAALLGLDLLSGEASEG